MAIEKCHPPGDSQSFDWEKEFFRIFCKFRLSNLTGIVCDRIWSVNVGLRLSLDN